MKLLRRIRLICADLDETLLLPDHRVSERSAALVRRLLQAGVAVALCTGRAPETTRPIAAGLGVVHYICNNGAVVFADGQVIAQRTMPARLVRAIARFCVSQGVHCYVMSGRGYFATGVDAAIERGNAVRGVAPAILPAEACHLPAHKVQAMGGARLYDAMVRRWGTRAHFIHHPDYVEIAPRGVNKAWGARRLAAHLRVPQEAVLALGDAMGDLELLRWAGLGVAMGDGAAAVRAAADFVTLPHTEDGVAPVLKAVLRAREES